MELKKIGEYIAKKRKEKKLTQQELADKVNVSVKAISKWECGKGLPEITNLQMLAKELDISMIDVLNGEDSKKEEAVVEYVKKREKVKSKKIIVLYTIILILLIIIVLSSYFACNYNKIYAYKLSGENENFSFDSGLILASNYSNIISTGNINVKDKEFEKKINIINIELRNNNEVVLASNSLYDKSYLAVEKNGYEELIKGNVKDTEWSLDIIYLLDKEILKETIEIKMDLLFKNNKIISKKTERISEERNVVVNGVDYSHAIELRKYLVEKKEFREHEDDFGYVTKTLKNEQGELISSIHVLPFSGVIRGIYNFDNIQITLNYSYYNIVTNKKINNNVVQLSGEYQELIEESKDNQKNNSKKYFTILFNMKTGESECTYGECPDNHWEISKTIYDDLSYILDY